MSQLVLLQDGQATPYPLGAAEATIGRLSDCTIQLPSNMVSRKHAKVYQQGSDYYLEDLGSGNGTFVNGTKIDGAYKLQHNDRIKFGPVLLRFESDAVGATASNLKTFVSDAGTAPQFEISDDKDDPSTIMGAIDTSGFNVLESRPQEKLKAILEISRALAGTLEVEKLLPKILDALFKVFPGADRGCILLKNDKGDMVPQAMKHRRSDTDESVKISRTILNAVLEQKQAILSADAASDSRFDASESISALTIRSMMCAPMLNLQGEPVGAINIDTQNPVMQFRSDDLEIMLAIAGQAALAYEGREAVAVFFVEKQKQDSEMNIAANVQQALLPDRMPECTGYEFFASYEAAQAVGGDYYDVIPLTDGRVCLAFGDVAGKGVPASLVMSRMSSAVRTLVEHVPDPVELVGKINDHMCAKAVEGRFVTFVLTILDTVNHRMQVVNAGHMSPMIRKPDGSIEELDEETIGVPIGVMEGFPFEVVEREIHPGETIVIYTDGVSEAMNPQSDLYGMDRLREIVSNGSRNPEELGVAIREDVRRHASGRPQNDDITLMVFGRLS